MNTQEIKRNLKNGRKVITNMGEGIVVGNKIIGINFIMDFSNESDIPSFGIQQIYDIGYQINRENVKRIDIITMLLNPVEGNPLLHEEPWERPTIVSSDRLKALKNFFDCISDDVTKDIVRFGFPIESLHENDRLGTIMYKYLIGIPDVINFIKHPEMRGGRK